MRLPHFFALLLAPAVAGVIVDPRPSLGGERDDADAVLERYVQAVGGKTAIEAVQTRVTQYEVSLGPGINGTIELLQQRPDRVVERGVIKGFMGWSAQVSRGFNGTTAWDQGPEQPLRLLQGEELGQYVLTNRLDRDVHLKELYPARRSLADRPVDGKLFRAVEMTSTSGQKEVWYVDPATALLVRIESSTKGVVRVLGDYREVDGILVPFQVSTGDGKRSLMMRAKSIKHNVPLMTEDFASPMKHN